MNKESVHRAYSVIILRLIKLQSTTNNALIIEMCVLKYALHDRRSDRLTKIDVDFRVHINNM